MTCSHFPIQCMYILYHKTMSFVNKNKTRIKSSLTI
ncbi:hypothetical protein CoNPh11_CDS0189 [Staphylococcus phage S-CoN_Ph11]|nr:hypothetical protein CoNPh7_CDS0147 [Staphylococcus phage S-CoN_Ph7]WNM53246.1 hypothetical protein CoNPh11_CDS0189 [Staphylococcus phage S-CoN_Ph11]